jgi:hypothetical protein
VRILFEGMAGGWFTGKSFKSYIDNIDESDAEDGREFEDARRIINGTDKAKLISGYALKYEAALRAAGYGKRTAPQAKPAAPPAPPVKTNWLSALIAALVSIFKRKSQ